MTIICALRSQDGVWIGSDSRVSKNSGFVCPAPFDKWAKTAEGILWGISGHLRLASIIGTLPGVKTVAQFSKALRDATKEDGWSAEGNKHGEPCDWCFDVIAVIDGKVYEINGSGSVVDFEDNFCALGSGREFAYGAAFALDDMDPEVIVRTAVESACKYDSSCGEPIFVEHIPCASA